MSMPSSTRPPVRGGGGEVPHHHAPNSPNSGGGYYSSPQARYFERSTSDASSDITEEVEHLTSSHSGERDGDGVSGSFDHSMASSSTSPTHGGGGGGGGGGGTNNPNSRFRRLQNRANRRSHQRVPGGAAAKLIGRPRDDSEEELPLVSSDGDDPAVVKPPTDELDRIRQETVDEFAKGPKTNRRYHEVERDHDDESVQKSPSIASTPSILDRSEVFHENATAAVLSLLNPPTGTGSDEREQSPPRPVKGVVEAANNDFTQGPMPVESRNAFIPPHKADNADDTSSVSAVKLPLSPRSVPTSELTASGKIQLQQPLLPKKAEMKLARLSDQMINPSKKLTELMTAIAAPEDGRFTRGYMVRRKNACGALQVLTANRVNRVQICYTVGVLPSITSVLEDGCARKNLEEVFPDRDTRREYIEARKRAVSALMNLSVPTQNRICIFHSPKLIPALIRVIIQDQEESRKGCCAVLAQLAKTKENRLLMTQIPGLIDSTTYVIEPESLKPKRSKKDERRSPGRSMDDDDSASDESETGNPDIVESFYSDEQLTNDENDDDDDDDDESPKEEDPIAASKRYDGNPNVHLHGARQNIFALLGHLVKEKDNVYHLARHKYLVETLVAVSKLHESGAHEHAVKMMANLTRHRGNSKEIVFKLRSFVPAIVKATVSMNDEARKHACFALQNLSQDKPCRQELAATDDLLTALCVRIRQAANPEERLSAIHALKNLTDEPANLIPMTNTPECFATLMQIAHASDDSVTEMMQYLGCDALATLSHWFRSIATSGKRIDTVKRGHKPSKDLFVPTLKIVTWQRWQ